MSIEKKLLENSMKINLEIINFKNELYEMVQSDLSHNELLEVSSDINYIVGAFIIQNLAIETILIRINNDPFYEANNKEFLNGFLNNLEEYCNKYNVGTREQYE